ncbi:MAG: hypothetical protein RR068_02380 [Hafnia sp.]
MFTENFSKIIREVIEELDEEEIRKAQENVVKLQEDCRGNMYNRLNMIAYNDND